jgi:hypothetical protein
MKWAIALPWVNAENQSQEYWVDSYIDREAHQFETIIRPKPLTSWHNRKSKFTSFDEWLVYYDHATRALNSDCDGVITAFPQMPALLAGCQKIKLKPRKPVVAWGFAVGNLSGGLRRQLAKMSLSDVDHFTVLTRREQKMYSEWLNLPIEKFEFVPMVEKPLNIEGEEEQKKPFIAAMGSAHRDFPTLFKVIEKLNIRTIVACSRAALAGVEIPAMVETPFGIGRDDCLKLSKQGRFTVVVMHNRPDIPAAGIATIIESLHMGRPVIATRCNGAEDYIVHGETGLLVEPGSEGSLQEAIETLWWDDALRQRMGIAAKQYADAHLSYDAGAKALTRILDGIAEGR